MSDVAEYLLKSYKEMTMFEKIEMAPPDAIFGLKEAYAKDPNPNKINLTVGVYKDDSGQTPIFRTVKLAEARMLEEEESKSYLSIDGSAEYAAAVQGLVFGADHEVVTSARGAKGSRWSSSLPASSRDASSTSSSMDSSI